MPEFNKGVMRPNLNTVPNQQLSIQPDANINKECLGSKRSNYHLGVPDDDEDEDVVFLRETLPSESGHHCPSKRQRVEAHPPPDQDDETLGSGMDVVEPMETDKHTKREGEANNADSTMPLEKPKKRDVSLVERFTEEEIEMHLKSLHEGRVELKDIETCQLCGESQLLFPAPPLYCSLCNCRIQDESLYYIPEETISGAQHQICSPCYDHCRRQKFTLSGVDIVKANMLKLNNANNQETEAVSFISLSLSIYIYIYIFLQYIYIATLFCLSSGLLANLAGNGSIRYVVFTIQKKTLTKPRTTFVPTAC